LSPPVWGQIAANMGNIWVKSFYELLPQYLEELGVKMMFNGFVSALPPLGRYSGTPVFMEASGV